MKDKTIIQSLQVYQDLRDRTYHITANFCTKNEDAARDLATQLKDIMDKYGVGVPLVFVDKDFLKPSAVRRCRTCGCQGRCSHDFCVECNARPDEDVANALAAIPPGSKPN